MIIVLFYLFIGLVSYGFVAREDGIIFKAEDWLEIIIAAVIWAVIWLPLLLYKLPKGRE